MRLIRLKVRNIASLRGEHEIDFTEIQRHSSLFAITGETGSGKSTILNAIGLALFGQVYKKNVTQLDVVTLGEKDGSIELIIEAKGKFYLADWRARVRKQNGEPYSTPQSPVRNLYHLDGPDFSSAKNIAAVSAQELLNLDFDQFCKCVILNQGEFARFLQSSFTERKDILEKLYPGELLESMGRELKAELDQLERSRNEIEIRLGELKADPVSGEVLKDQANVLKGKLQNLEAASKLFEQLDYHFVSLFTYFENYNKNEKNKEKVRAEIIELTTKHNTLLKTGEAVQEKYQSAIKKRDEETPFLQSFIKKEESLDNSKERLKTTQKKISAIKEELSKLSVLFAEKGQLEKMSGEKLEEATRSLHFSLPLLKNNKENIGRFLDLLNELGPLEAQIKGKQELLSNIEKTGKDMKSGIDKIEAALKDYPENLSETEKDLEAKKAELKKREDKKQRAIISSEEISKSIALMNASIEDLTKKIEALNGVILKTKEEIFPLETTLKLQEVLNATEICLNHAIDSDTDKCPVCEQTVPGTRWAELKTKVQTTNLEKIRISFEQGQKLLFRTQEEAEVNVEKLLKDKEAVRIKNLELEALKEIREEELPSVTELETEISKIRTQLSEADYLRKDRDAKNLELRKVREQYAVLKKEIASLEEVLVEKTQRRETLREELKDFVKDLTPDTLRDLRLELKNLDTCLECEANLAKAKREKEFLEAQSLRLKESLGDEEKEETSLQGTIASLAEEIQNSLKGEKASDLIAKLNLAAKSATDDWSKQQEEQKALEKSLKELQGRLYPLDQLTQDYDLHYSKELHAIKDLSSRESEKPESSPLLLKLKELALNFQSPRELFIPLQELISGEKEKYRKEANDVRMEFASVSTKLQEWEKVQDKMQLLTLQNKEISENLARKMRLFEVLGKDELRTFVLALVEESLIEQTNVELQKLCQGRYEIVHQTRSMKMTPEFYILDKFREGGKRKVSTLSGGETFMVSLAMALGLAEMTRGQAEIDSLFIDEGFGTLDQESLEDVLDMLQQIQTRGLLVGVISHIKTLTSAIPVNLVLNKKQDGVSTIALQLN